MQFIGKIVHITDSALVGQNQIAKRSLVIQATDKDAESIVVDFRWRMADELSDYRVGEHVAVQYKTKYNEYNGKYYNSLKGESIQTITDNRLLDTPYSEDNDLPF